MSGTSIRVVNDPKEFDQVVHGLDGVLTLRDAGDLAIVLKPNGKQCGNPIAAVTFIVQLPDGTTARAQTLVTVANLQMALMAINAWDEGGHLEGGDGER